MVKQFWSYTICDTGIIYNKFGKELVLTKDGSYVWHIYTKGGI